MKAFYHTEGNAPHEMVVLKKNKDGSLVDIGPEGGPAIVTDCPVFKGENPTPGTATLGDDSVKPADATPPADDSGKDKKTK